MISERGKKRLMKKTQNGFSFVELLIAVVLAAILVAVIYQLYTSYMKTVYMQEDMVEIQQAARNALGKLKNDLMLIGRNVEEEEGQEVVIYASPWELGFNGDITERGQLPVGQTVTIGGSNYSSARDWESDAETVHYYMHAPATGPSSIDKDFSYSDYDREIRRQINKYGTGTTPNRPDTMGYGVRYDSGTSPTNWPYGNGERVVPLFTYWGDFDFDPTTADTLWGDANGDLVLSTGEIEALYAGSYQHCSPHLNASTCYTGMAYGGIFLVSSTSNSEVALGQDVNRNGRLDTNVLGSAIHRIELNITTIAQNPDPTYHHSRDGNYHYREHWIHTAVEPRNLTKVEERDCGGPPGAPTGASLTQLDCGRGMRLAWNRSPDDGANDNDVLWYEVQRMINATGSDFWEFLTFVPAEGLASYAYIDTDITPGLSHDYRVVAVDCGDGRSDFANVNAITPNPPFVTAPDSDYIFAFNTPCYASPSASYGSITLMWPSAMASPVSKDQYWIYRSDPEEIDTANDWVLARVDAAGSDGPNTSCATSPGNWFQSHIDCRNQTYYTMGNMYVWRDQVNSPGRDGGALLPKPGYQFGIGSSSGLDKNRYFYEVRAYKWDNSNSWGCLSDPGRLQSECANYEEVQSFSVTTGGQSPTDNRAFWAPPTNVSVEDASILTYEPYPHNVELVRFNVYWDASLNQYPWCNSATGIQWPDYYYVYRTARGGYSDDFLTSNGTVNFDDYSGRNILQFRATPYTMGQINYSFVDSDANFRTDAAHTARWINASTRDLRPSGSIVGAGTGALRYVDDSVNRAHYEYVIAAANTYSSGAPHPTWAFGASCVVEGHFTCDTGCDAAVLAGSGYAEQHSMKGDEYPGRNGDDSIDVYWKFDPNHIPPSGSVTAHIYLEAAEWLNDNWFTVEDLGEQNWGTGLYHGAHLYGDQEPGTIYDYSLRVVCSSGCERRILIGATIGSCTPGIPYWCVQSNQPDCPADTGAYCGSTNNGLIIQYITDTLPEDYGHTMADPFSQTENASLWFRIARWERVPMGVYDLVPTAEYLIRCDGYEHVDPVTPPGARRFVAFPGTWSQDFTADDRRYKLTMYLNPGMVHRFQVETRVTHTGAAPRDCNAPLSTCNGPDDSYEYYHFANAFPCYPYPYAGFSGTQPIHYYQFDYFGGRPGSYKNVGSTGAGGKSYIPWKNYEVTFISFSMWGTTWHAGDHIWRYHYLSTINGQIESDLAAFYAPMLLNWPVQWFREVGWDLCTFCWKPLPPFGVPPYVFCVNNFWSSCPTDLANIFGTSFMWSNFASGRCESTGYGLDHSITGDFMMHWHWKSIDPDRKLVMAFRAELWSFAMPKTWLIEQDFTPGGGDQYYHLYYQDRVQCEREVSSFRSLTNDVTDTQWHANLLAVCTRRQETDPNRGQMHIMYWNETDPYTNLDLQQNPAQYQVRINFSTISGDHHRFGPGAGGPPYYDSNPSNPDPFHNVAYSSGAVGFWANPYSEWKGGDMYTVDRVRIIEYCGDCPFSSAKMYPESKKITLPSKAPDWGTCTDVLGVANW